MIANLIALLIILIVFLIVWIVLGMVFASDVGADGWQFVVTVMFWPVIVVIGLTYCLWNEVRMWWWRKHNADK